MLIKESSPEPESIDREKRQITFLASSAEKDRDGDVIEPTSFEKSLRTYMTNPVILSQHQSRLSSGNSSVVGKAVKIWTDAKGLWVTVQFADTPLGREYWELYSQGYQRSVSVGFIPIESHDEIIEGERVRTYDEVELLEISLVAVPSNRSALARSKANKLAFIEKKREGKMLEEIRQEYARQGRAFDAECEEFAELLLTGDFGDKCYHSKTEIDYTDLVRR